MGLNQLSCAVIFLHLALPLSAQTVVTQRSPAEAAREGKKMFQQRCSVCHMPPVLGDATPFGPLLSTESVVRKADQAREIIAHGARRMPGFKYGLEPQEIDNIIAYIKTVRKSGPQD